MPKTEIVQKVTPTIGNLIKKGIAKTQKLVILLITEWVEMKEWYFIADTI